MKVNNVKEDKYGYKLIGIRPFEYSIACSGSIHNYLKFKKGLSAEYVNIKRDETVTIKFPYIKPFLLGKLRLKKYLMSKNFIEVLSENIFNVFENPSVNLVLSEEQINDLMELLPHDTTDKKAMSMAIYKQIIDTQLKNKELIQTKNEETL